jgi:hypothetical protein
MAALRYATRQFADRALPRLQAVCTASAAQRRLLQTMASSTSSRRVTSSGRNTAKVHHSPVPINSNTCANNALRGQLPQLDENQKERLVRTQLAQIQKKKEELFSLITQMDSKLPGQCTKVNKQLAMDLSAQVEPKPNDPQWYVWSQTYKRLSCFLLSFLTLLY